MKQFVCVIRLRKQDDSSIIYIAKQKPLKKILHQFLTNDTNRRGLKPFLNTVKKRNNKNQMISKKTHEDNAHAG